MTITAKMRHWFTPHHTNNFRARLLHNTSIFVMIGIVITANVFINLLDNPLLHILGFTSSITIDEVVRSTNEIRIGAGLKPLSYNEKLADAARRKAANMFSENYWAHNSPSGKSPWVWFKEAGYSYVFAGENLAKDFGDTTRMMNAWMDSPTHHDNIVNSKYTQIGLAVVPGSIAGSDTVLVVQLFGTPATGAVAPPVQGQKTQDPLVQVEPAPVQVAEIKAEEIVPSPPSSPLPATPPRFNQFTLSRTLSLFTTLLFMLALIIDLILAESQKLSRRVGNNWAHILFINLILLATTIVNAGKIM